MRLLLIVVLFGCATLLSASYTPSSNVVAISIVPDVFTHELTIRETRETRAQSCVEEITECQECEDTTHCKTCKPSYFLGEDNTTCESCGPNCIACDKGGLCKDCDSGYFKNSTSSNTTICTKCSDRCALCSDGTACDKCDEGYLLDTAGLCKECNATVPHCTACDKGSDGKTNCTTCSPGYYAKGGACVACADAGCGKCEFNPNNSSLTCSSCLTGYFPNGAGNCSTCASKGCLECNSTDGTCGKCLGDNYSLKDGVCTVCEPNCLKCNDQTCFACNSTNGNFFINGLKCEACTIEGCTNCTSANVCATCNDIGYFKKADDTCGKCLSFCATCINASICNECIKEPVLHFLSKNNSNCDAILTTCPLGTYPKGDSPAECRNCMTNCTNCTAADTCATCTDGNFFSEKTCKSCNTILEGCISCTDDQTCTECGLGVYLDETTHKCKSCSVTGCEDCQKNKCSKCSGTKLLYNDKCVDTCPDGSYNKDNIVCEDCQATNCKKCEKNECSECKSDFPYHVGAPIITDCYAQCPNKTFSDKDKLCTDCITNCDKCGNKTECEICSITFYGPKCDKSCMKHCDRCDNDTICNVCSIEFFVDQKSACSSCLKDCNHCDDAITCRLGGCKQDLFYYNSTCSATCPVGLYKDAKNRICSERFESDGVYDSDSDEGVRSGVFVLFGLGMVVLVMVIAIYWRKRRQVRRTQQYMMMDV